MAGYHGQARARPGQVAEAVTGEGDLVGDVAAGRQSLSAVPERAAAGQPAPHVAG